MSVALTFESAVARGAPERLVIINPLEYPHWDRLVSGQRDGSFFHSAAWARVLHETYGHSPCYFCSFSNGQLEKLLPVMEVSSLVTGPRGVSLPFSDFCAPLVRNGDAGHLFEAALEYGRGRKWKYLECRGPVGRPCANVEASLIFHGHIIELKSGEEGIFRRFSGAVRRGVRKARSKGISVELSASPDSLTEFFELHCRTRRRHGLPPQPFRFFQNIGRHILATGHGIVATARLGKTPLAALVFFYFGSEAIYKFGASDFAFQHLRPNNLAIWEAIRYFAAKGFGRLHLGRTSIGHEGLRQFKLGFGAREERVEYQRYDFKRCTYVAAKDRATNFLNQVFQRLPVSVLRLTGEVVYPHLS